MLTVSICCVIVLTGARRQLAHTDFSGSQETKCIGLADTSFP